MRRSDYPDTLAPLCFKNFFVELFHLRPMQFGPEMVLSVIAIIEPEQIVPFMIRTHAPGDRFVGIAAVMQKVTIQIGAAVTEVIKWEKI